MRNKRIVLATPHERYDSLETALRERDGFEVLRVRTREELTLDVLATFSPEYVFLPHWSWKIPAPIQEAFECVIFHMTDVPFGRGGSPLQNLIVRGFEETKLSALRCVAELDSGPVYLKRPLLLGGTAEEILLRASMLMETMIVEIVETRPTPIPQQGEVIEFKRRTPADGNMALVERLSEAYDVIRMLDGDGYPPAFIDVGRLHLEFSGAHLGEGFVDAKVRITERDND